MITDMLSHMALLLQHQLRPSEKSLYRILAVAPQHAVERLPWDTSATKLVIAPLQQASGPSTTPQQMWLSLLDATSRASSAFIVPAPGDMSPRSSSDSLNIDPVPAPGADAAITAAEIATLLKGVLPRERLTTEEAHCHLNKPKQCIRKCLSNVE